MDINRTNQILRVAKMYHELGMSQLEIAKKEEISKPTVCRLLKKAEKLGFVKTYVVQPFFSTADLESEIMERYHLKKVTVIPNLINNKQALIRDLNKALLDDLEKLVKNGDVIGVAWGRTMTDFAKEANTRDPLDKKHIRIVQLNGGVSTMLDSSGSYEVVRSMSRLFRANTFQICAPAFVKRRETAEMIKEDPQVSSVLDWGRRCDIAIFSAGLLKRDSVIFTLGCLNDKDYDNLIEKDSVGDICSHFIGENGELSDPEFDARSMAIDITEIKKIPNKILIAHDKEKAKIVKAIIDHQLADRLYIDEELAKVIIR